MTADAVIEATAKKLSGMFAGPVEAWFPGARALADAGLLVSELPAEPLPEGQRRADPYGGSETVVKARGFWVSTEGKPARRDHEVADWPVLVPETDLDDLRAERDRLKARVAELEAAEECALDECVASLSVRLSEFVQRETGVLLEALASVMKRASQAELARRDAELRAQ